MRLLEPLRIRVIALHPQSLGAQVSTGCPREWHTQTGEKMRRCVPWRATPVKTNSGAIAFPNPYRPFADITSPVTSTESFLTILAFQSKEAVVQQSSRGVG
jgi:hypothetical protein